jgi:outer membrane protein insertion porin family
MGKGESLSLKYEFGNLTQVDISYRNPWFRDRPTTVGADIYNTRAEYDTYTDRRTGFALVTGRRLPFIDYASGYVRYSLEHREIEPDDDASAYVRSQAGEYTTSRITATLSRNSIDNPFFARSGSRTTARAEWAGALLGGTTAYHSYTVESSNYIAVPVLNSALLFRASSGVIDGLGGDGYIPVYERFRLGGTSSEAVRGYDDREIVPEGNDYDVGGRFMLLGTVEYRVPVIKNQAFARAFFDAGNTWNSVRGARPWLLRRSAGFGFMIEIPMVGQIGLDVGYGFDREEDQGGPGWKSHFQFGMSGL